MLGRARIRAGLGKYALGRFRIRQFGERLSGSRLPRLALRSHPVS
jgi:hypothetical protein